MRWLRLIGGLAYGAATGLVELLGVAIAGAGLAASFGSPRARTALRARIDPLAGRLAGLELRRIQRYAGPVAELPAEHEPVRVPAVRQRALGYLAARCWIGILGGLVLLALLFGIVTVASTLAGWLFGFPFPLVSDAGGVTADIILALAVPGLVLFFLNVTGIHGVAALDRRLAVGMLGSENAEEYRRRIAELASTRAGVVAAVNDERRRIERALHDGVQQHIVMLSLLIGRARRSTDPDQQAELMRQAHEETQRALDELRETAWRIYPSALDTGGLRAALESVAERTAIPLVIDYRLPARPPRSHEALAYFLVSEAVTNAVKHAQASKVEVAVTLQDDTMRIGITDDGIGGADPAGSGLSGLAGRVYALDGRFRVDSPDGGPTSIVAELPWSAACE